VLRQLPDDTASEVREVETVVYLAGCQVSRVTDGIYDNVFETLESFGVVYKDLGLTLVGGGCLEGVGHTVGDRRPAEKVESVV